MQPSYLIPRRIIFKFPDIVYRYDIITTRLPPTSSSAYTSNLSIRLLKYSTFYYMPWSPTPLLGQGTHTPCHCLISYGYGNKSPFQPTLCSRPSKLATPLGPMYEVLLEYILLESGSLGLDSFKINGVWQYARSQIFCSAVSQPLCQAGHEQCVGMTPAIYIYTGQRLQRFSGGFRKRTIAFPRYYCHQTLFQPLLRTNIHTQNMHILQYHEYQWQYRSMHLNNP